MLLAQTKLRTSDDIDCYVGSYVSNQWSLIYNSFKLVWLFKFIFIGSNRKTYMMLMLILNI